MGKLMETGKIVTTQGIAGEVKIQPWSDSPEFLLGFDAFYVGSPARELRASGKRLHKGCVLVKFEGVDDINAAVGLVGEVVYIDRDSVKLPKGTYFIQDLVGLSVVDADTGEVYGRLSEVLQTGANDVYVVSRPAGGEALVPAIRDVIVETDVLAGEMRIRPIKGLFE